jgi:nicotinamidase-related amidase
MTDAPWLVVIDMQRVFAAGSPWASPDYAAASAGVRRLLPHFGDRVVFTRYVAPERPTGAWVPYFEQWPFALVSPDDPLYDLTDEFDPGERAVVTRPTFGKWGPELAAATGGASELVLAGVSTDCCVLSTALPAADAGIRVRVAADACAGASREDHQRALDAMALYAPLVEVTSVDDLLAGHGPAAVG